MGVKKVIKNGLFGPFNPKRLFGYSEHKENVKNIGGLYKRAFSYKKDAKDEAAPKIFEDCMRYYNLSEDGLKKKMKTSLKVVWFCLGLAAITFGYMFFQFMHTSILGGILCLLLTSYLLATAFREHFNLFQMRERRLGCTKREWLRSLLKRKSA